MHFQPTTPYIRPANFILQGRDTPITSNNVINAGNEGTDKFLGSQTLQISLIKLKRAARNSCRDNCWYLSRQPLWKRQSPIARTIPHRFKPRERQLPTLPSPIDVSGFYRKRSPKLTHAQTIDVHPSTGLPCASISDELQFLSGIIPGNLPCVQGSRASDLKLPSVAWLLKIHIPARDLYDFSEPVPRGTSVDRFQCFAAFLRLLTNGFPAPCLGKEKTVAEY